LPIQLGLLDGANECVEENTGKLKPGWLLFCWWAPARKGTSEIMV
jgi:hypothetical protein